MAATATSMEVVPSGGAEAPILVDTQHEDLVHDAQLDYYGAKLATCSSGEFDDDRGDALSVCRKNKAAQG